MSAAERIALTRGQKVDLIRRTLGAHPDLTHAEVAELLGMTLSALRNLLCDPDGSKQRRRRERYRRPCANCGRLLDGSSGYRGNPTGLCLVCSAEQQHAERRWTREAVIAAGLAWIERYGEPPTATEWSTASKPGAPIEHPASVTIYGGRWRRGRGSPFASWAEFLAALGWERPRGRYLRVGDTGLHASGRRVLDELQRRELTIGDTAALLGVTYMSGRAVLRGLVRRGLVERAGSGYRGQPHVYRLAGGNT